MRRRDWMEPPKNRFLRGVYLLVQRYLRHNVGMQGAALAFYLLFMIFPLLIFISSLLGLLQLDVEAILTALGEFLPREVVSFIGMYLTYVGRNPSVKLLLFGLFFSLYFPMRATNTLMRSVRIAYHLGPPRGALTQLVKTLVYTTVLIGTIALTGVELMPEMDESMVAVDIDMPVGSELEDISAMADRVLILQDGRIVEYGAVPQVMNHPQSAYTRQLLDAVPKLRRD